MDDSRRRYGGADKFFHWTIAALIFALIALGWWMVGLDYYDRRQPDALHWHRALGVLVFVLACAKLLRRCFRAPPPPLADLRRWEKIASKIVHRILFALMFLLPASGYVISTSDGKAVDLIGGLKAPALFAISDAVRDAAIAMHYWLAYFALGLAALHMAAALKHHFADKNRTLRRMLWG